jgi:hypothetical protein
MAAVIQLYKSLNNNMPKSIFVQKAKGQLATPFASCLLTTYMIRGILFAARRRFDGSGRIRAMPSKQCAKPIAHNALKWGGFSSVLGFAAAL